MAFFAASANASVAQKRGRRAARNEAHVVTATKIRPSLVDYEPYMVSVTSEVVWTQYAVPTTSGDTNA
ncbi:hypothetical protein K435DRAFT_870265 [Dendrothele bispora CBS 962.96]|uniref:Uncharacterized protein n=1 Tax=Dendrothele bispora (strain CBS 962.96) TaxID=1314807 RepID=A0A4S8L702_DENBC|nr:hypothetical protein K435DRAFT_870265 [Dendrothele bispora CBS 962.96]